MARCEFKSSFVTCFFLFLFCLTITSAIEADQDGDASTTRDGKFLNGKFWNGFEKGIKDTAQIFSRVSDNLEVAIDQITSDLTDNFSTLADKIERRVGGSFPPFLREDAIAAPSGQEFSLDAIGGSLGGVDDGLEVYYPKKEAAEGVEAPIRGTKIDTSMFPRFDNVDPTDEGPGQGLDVDYFNPFGQFGGGKGIFNIFRRRKPWWQRNNICVDREEIDDTESTKKKSVGGAEAEAEAAEADTTGIVSTDSNKPSSFNFFSSLQMSSCKDSGETYSCVTSTNRRGLHKTVKVTYRCCHGFVRDGSGCSKIDIFPMPETLEKLASTSDFLSLIKAANMVDRISSSNFTLFVPNNEAIEEYTADMEEKNEIQNNIDGMRNDVYRRKRETHNLEPTLLGHIAEGFYYAGDFADEMIIPSLNEKSSLRVNIYNSNPPSVTVNCARIITANQHSLNGVVHTIDRVIEPALKSIADIIASDPQFTILKKLLSNTGLVEELRKDGQYTFFAPTDAAFRRLKPSVLKSLTEGSTCLEAVLKHHILPNSICSTAIQGKMKTMNILDDFLIVERTEDDKLFIEDAQIVVKDIMGTNGVLHIVDKTLIPNEAKPVSEVLEFHNLTKFMELLELAELTEEFDSLKDITVFAPSNAAIEKILEEEISLLKADKEKLKELLRYHVTTPTVKARNINNNQLVNSTSGLPLRINLYSGVPLLSGLFRVQSRHPMRMTAGCSRVSILDSRACGAIVHVVENMLEIPKSNILEALEEENFSIFKQMVEDTGINKELKGEGPYTLLVPSNHAFKTLPEEELNDIMKNEKLKERIVRKHIMQEHVCCSGINSNNWLFMDRKRTMDGSNIHIRRSPNGRIMAGAARIIDCGAPTVNGVVHTVNRMIVDDRELLEGNNGHGPGGLRVFPMRGLENLFVI